MLVRGAVLAVVALVALVVQAAPPVAIEPDVASGVYQSGETVTWTISADPTAGGSAALNMPSSRGA